MPKPKKNKRFFYKTVFKLEVLSEDTPLEEDITLSGIEYAIGEGDCVGQVEMTEVKKLSARQVVRELYGMGSEPSFFQLDDQGRDIED